MTSASVRCFALVLFAAYGCAENGPEQTAEVASDPLPISVPLVRALSQEPKCKYCVIALDSIATIGLPEDTIFPIEQAEIVQAADQLFYAHPLSDNLKIGRYDWSGALVDVFGGRGESPGKYRFAGTLAASADSQLLLLEYRKGHWYDLRTLMSVTSPVAVPLNQPALIALPGRRFLASTTGGVGMPGEFYLSERAGEGTPIGRTTSPRTSNTATLGGASMFRSVSGLHNGTFFAMGSFFGPVLERWSTKSGLRDRVELPAPWYDPYDIETMTAARASGRPLPEVLSVSTAIRYDASGRLWTITRVPDPRAIARPSPPSAQSGVEAHRPSPVVAQRASREQADAVVAVYQVSDSGATLLASQRFDQRVMLFLSDSVVAERSVPEPGLTRFILYKLRFSRGITR